MAKNINIEKLLELMEKNLLGLAASVGASTLFAYLSEVKRSPWYANKLVLLARTQANPLMQLATFTAMFLSIGYAMLFLKEKRP